MSVIVNDGSTAAVLGKQLTDIHPLTVITNNDAVIQTPTNKLRVDLLAVGGVYSGKYTAYFGEVTEDALINVRADLAFISSPAISATPVYHMGEVVMRLKRAMMAAAAHTCLLVSHTRFGHKVLYRFAEMGNSTMWLPMRRRPRRCNSSWKIARSCSPSPSPRRIDVSAPQLGS